MIKYESKSATSPETRAIERRNLEDKGNQPEELQLNINTAVGHIAVNFGEGKVVRLPLNQESLALRQGSCQYGKLDAWGRGGEALTQGFHPCTPS
jgi:hypothetical protein